MEISSSIRLLQRCTFQLIVGFIEMLAFLALRNNGELESFSSALLISQRGVGGSLNWRKIQSKNKLVCENAVTRV